MKTRIIAAAVALTVLLTPTGVALASSICTNNPCAESEVGPFMVGISKSCGNEGTCSLVDIEKVFDNVASFVLSIVGALVFLMYVVGGFYFLLSGMPGMEKYREKGKSALKTSTIGLIIIFSSYALIQTLRTVLKGGDISNGVTSYVSCGPGPVNSGEPCAYNSACNDSGGCEELCYIYHPAPTAEEIAAGTATSWSCVDTNLPTYSGLTCEVNLCQGGDNNKCCDTTYR